VTANIWWTVPNISASLGNNVFAFFDGTSNRSITIPDGLYDIDQLASTIPILIDNIPASLPAESLFVFAGDNATQKVIITFKSANLSINWNLSTIRSIIGFLPTSPSTVGIGQSLIADNIANFNVITSFLIHTDLINSGIPVNSVNSAVISNVLIDVSPGNLINYAPSNVPVVDADELIGVRRTNIRFRLTDQSNRRVDTNGEYWSFMVVIRYYLPEP
jgi:hypothetical protein